MNELGLVLAVTKWDFGIYTKDEAKYLGVSRDALASNDTKISLHQ